MLDDLRNYLQMASGLTEATASKAKDAVTGLLAHGRLAVVEGAAGAGDDGPGAGAGRRPRRHQPQQPRDARRDDPRRGRPQRRPDGLRPRGRAGRAAPARAAAGEADRRRPGGPVDGEGAGGAEPASPDLPRADLPARNRTSTGGRHRDGGRGRGPGARGRRGFSARGAEEEEEEDRRRPGSLSMDEFTDDATTDDVDESSRERGPRGEDVLLLEEVEDELVLPVWEPTGEPGVDAALDLLGQLDPDDVHQHAAVFDDIHQRLRATLTDLDAPS